MAGVVHIRDLHGPLCGWCDSRLGTRKAPSWATAEQDYIVERCTCEDARGDRVIAEARERVDDALALCARVEAYKAPAEVIAGARVIAMMVLRVYDNVSRSAAGRVHVDGD